MQPVQPAHQIFLKHLYASQAGVNDFNIFSYLQVPFLLFLSCAAWTSFLYTEMIQAHSPTCLKVQKNKIKKNCKKSPWVIAVHSRSNSLTHLQI